MDARTSKTAAPAHQWLPGQLGIDPKTGAWFVCDKDETTSISGFGDVHVLWGRSLINPKVNGSLYKVTFKESERRQLRLVEPKEAHKILNQAWQTLAEPYPSQSPKTTARLKEYMNSFAVPNGLVVPVESAKALAEASDFLRRKTEENASGLFLDFYTLFERHAYAIAHLSERVYGLPAAIFYDRICRALLPEHTMQGRSTLSENGKALKGDTLKAHILKTLDFNFTADNVQLVQPSAQAPEAPADNGRGTLAAYLGRTGQDNAFTYDDKPLVGYVPARPAAAKPAAPANPEPADHDDDSGRGDAKDAAEPTVPETKEEDAGEDYGLFRILTLPPLHGSDDRYRFAGTGITLNRLSHDLLRALATFDEPCGQDALFPLMFARSVTPAGRKRLFGYAVRDLAQALKDHFKARGETLMPLVCKDDLFALTRDAERAADAVHLPAWTPAPEAPRAETPEFEDDDDDTSASETLSAPAAPAAPAPVAEAEDAEAPTADGRIPQGEGIDLLWFKATSNGQPGAAEMFEIENTGNGFGGAALVLMRHLAERAGRSFTPLELAKTLFSNAHNPLAALDEACFELNASVRAALIALGSPVADVFCSNPDGSLYVAINTARSLEAHTAPVADLRTGTDLTPGKNEAPPEETPLEETLLEETPLEETLLEETPLPAAAVLRTDPPAPAARMIMRDLGYFTLMTFEPARSGLTSAVIAGGHAIPISETAIRILLHLHKDENRGRFHSRKDIAGALGISLEPLYEANKFGAACGELETLFTAFFGESASALFRNVRRCGLALAAPDGSLDEPKKTHKTRASNSGDEAFDFGNFILKIHAGAIRKPVSISANGMSVTLSRAEGLLLTYLYHETRRGQWVPRLTVCRDALHDFNNADSYAYVIQSNLTKAFEQLFGADQSVFNYENAHFGLSASKDAQGKPLPLPSIPDPRPRGRHASNAPAGSTQPRPLAQTPLQPLYYHPRHGLVTDLGAETKTIGDHQLKGRNGQLLDGKTIFIADWQIEKQGYGPLNLENYRTRLAQGFADYRARVRKGDDGGLTLQDVRNVMEATKAPDLLLDVYRYFHFNLPSRASSLEEVELEGQLIRSIAAVYPYAQRKDIMAHLEFLERANGVAPDDIRFNPYADSKTYANTMKHIRHALNTMPRRKHRADDTQEGHRTVSVRDISFKIADYLARHSGRLPLALSAGAAPGIPQDAPPIIEPKAAMAAAAMPDENLPAPRPLVVHADDAPAEPAPAVHSIPEQDATLPAPEKTEPPAKTDDRASQPTRQMIAHEEPLLSNAEAVRFAFNKAADTLDQPQFAVACEFFLRVPAHRTPVKDFMSAHALSDGELASIFARTKARLAKAIETDVPDDLKSAAFWVKAWELPKPKQPK